MTGQPLVGKVALVAGAGRGIAVLLGAAGATVYVTGRTTHSHRSEMDRPETIEETAALVDGAGGRGLAVAVDHLVPDEVAALAARFDGEQGCLHVLVNDIFGATRIEWTKSAMPLLFSYGTLQRDDVQLTTFGRRLPGQRDELIGCEPSSVKIDDPDVAATLGTTHHAKVTFTGNEGSRVAGTVFEITDAELARSDRFEAAFAYKRVAATLASGRRTWVYVDARSATDL